MSKELEALQYLKENKRRHWLEGDKSGECLDIIEKALKRLEEIDKVMFLNNQKIEKQDKILRIIKEKRVDTYFLMQTDTLEEYNNSLHTCSWFPNYELTQKEYELLREVLL